jgi:hypothetical protein
MANARQTLGKFDSVIRGQFMPVSAVSASQHSPSAAFVFLAPTNVLPLRHGLKMIRVDARRVTAKVI